MNDLSDKVVLVTGSTDGIGRETARILAERGAHVILHGRRENRCREAVKYIHRRVAEARLDYIVLDLCEMNRIRSIGSMVGAVTNRLDVLINNAGVGPGQHGQEREVTPDGYELRFAVNHLAPFALTRELLPFLQAGGDVRIVNVTSAAQAPLDFDDLMMAGEFDPMRAYSRSKLAMVMFTIDLAAHLANSGITVNCLHPGSLLDTKMVRETFGAARGSAEVGARNEVYLATSPDLDGVTGEYFDEARRRRPHEQALDEAARRRLWEVSEELTGVHY
ncbi:MAG: SDR family oxidoreductase [Spirochaetota bacterium]